MARRLHKKCLVMAGFGLFLLLAWSSAARCGPMKIIMKDGTSVEVPYFWVTDGEYKFDISGGTAGIPQSQVASVQEVLEAKDFDPESMIQSATEPSKAEQRKLIQELVSAKSPGAKREMGDPEEGAKHLRLATTREAPSGKAKVVGQSFNVEKALPFIDDESGTPTLVVQDLVSSRGDPKTKDFYLVLYDSEGGVLGRKQCDVYTLTLDQDAQRKLDVRTRILLVRASFKPEPKIKRYEIISAPR